MAFAQPKMIIRRYEGFGGNFIDSEYLGASYDANKPYVMEGLNMRIFASKSRFFTGQNLLGMTAMKPFGTKEIDNEVFRYKLLGAEYKCARVLEVIETGNVAPGLNGVTFRIKLDLDYFGYPDVLMPEDSSYPCQVKDAYTDGEGTIYVMELQGDDPTKFLPPYLLEVGREWSKVWTSVPSESNEYFGGQQYPEAFELEGQVGAFAQSVTVTDKALRMEGRLGVEIQMDGQTVRNFIPMAEAKMRSELRKSMEAQAWYGVKQTKKSPNGYWTKTGNGIREQLKDGFTERYNTIPSVNRFKDYLMDISFSRLDETDRKFVAFTGTLGSVQLHDVLASEAASFLTLDTHFIERYNAGLAGRHLSFGAQFRHYQGPEGIEFSLIKLPFYDSREFEKRTHPYYTEYPIDSGRYTFMDFGNNDGQQNVMALKVMDTYRYGYVTGTIGPNGPITSGQFGGLKAEYTAAEEGTFGVIMLDPTRGGELIMDTDY